MIRLIFITALIFASFIGNSQCNGYNLLCAKTYDEVAYLTTHNAYNAQEDNFQFPNQTYNIESQLNLGVRAFMVDVYDYFGTISAYHSTFLLGSIALSDILNDIKLFLDNNQNDIITIILESYVDADDIENIVNQSGLTNYLYTHNNMLAWPTLQEMINNNQRLVIFSDKDDASSTQTWYHYVWDYAVETHYSVNDINNFSCSFNRGNPNNDLFIFNHFVTHAMLGYGMYNESISVNANPFLINRALDCKNQHNKFPNFITLDFVELGNGLDAVNELNNIPTSSKDVEIKKEKEIISITNILGKEMIDRNNQVMLYIYSDGTVEKKLLIRE